jgi:cytochrome c oxidase cbb3-type subunit 2
MKTGFRVFVVAFVALGLSWCGLVLAPVQQLGTQGQTNILNSSEIYPNQRPGDATLGLQVYRANGCAACHTTQVGQDGVVCDVVLSGKNSAAASNLIASLNVTGLNEAEADAVSTKIKAAGGKTETHIRPIGTDISRGWGTRHSVAEDFLWDYPVQIGGVRVGPDLANIGMRHDASWDLMHLYNPKSNVPGSIMPPFRYLFVTQKMGDAPSPDALLVNDGTVPAGYEVVPTEDAKNLVAYLLSLRANVPLHDAPFSTAAPAPETKK